jgi:GTPase SAR1 family protein
LSLIARLTRGQEQPSSLYQAYEKWRELTDRWFLQTFASYNHPHDASIYASLQKFTGRLYEAVLIPEITNKTIVAIGGGFSAGKSNLINSIIGEELLPVDTTPTTSVATYIIHGFPAVSYAINLFGTRCVLDRDAISAITHAFSEEYAINLAPFLRHILVRVNGGKPFPYVILDTPGYSKSDRYKADREKDEYVARTALNRADSIIWVIDIERGDLPQEDIRFLKSLNNPEELFIVVNKADLKQKHEIDHVVKKIRKTLHEHDLAFTGIAAYSSKLKQDYGQDKLSSYLKWLGKKNKAPVDWETEFMDIVSPYRSYAERAVSHYRDKLEELNRRAVFSNNEQERELLKNLVKERRSQITKYSTRINEFGALTEPFLLALRAISDQLKTDAYMKSAEVEDYNANRQRLIHELSDKGFAERLADRFAEWTAQYKLENIPYRQEIQENIFVRLEELFSRSKSLKSAFEQNRFAIEDLLTVRRVLAEEQWFQQLWTALKDRIQERIIALAEECLRDMLIETSRSVADYSVTPSCRERLYALLKSLEETVLKDLQVFAFTEERVAEAVPSEDWSESSAAYWTRTVQYRISTYGTQMVKQISEHVNRIIMKQLTLEESGFEYTKS